MSLDIQSSLHENDTVVISIAGEITFDNSDQFKDKIDQQIEEGRMRIIVDLQNLSYMSSAGMGILVHGLKKCRAGGGDLRLINLGSKMRRVFLITQFTHQFMVFKELKQAVDSFKSDEKQVT
jgi:anti-sigma B factor antagonist